MAYANPWRKGRETYSATGGFAPKKLVQHGKGPPQPGGARTKGVHSKMITTYEFVNAWVKAHIKSERGASLV